MTEETAFTTHSITVVYYTPVITEYGLLRPVYSPGPHSDGCGFYDTRT